MKPSARRLVGLLVALALAGGAAAAVLFAFRDSLVYYRTPSEVAAGEIAVGEVIRLGGLVKADSIGGDRGTTVFVLTDLVGEVAVRTIAVLPSLFKENSGAVVEGSLAADGSFVATRVLAKHDENYRPPEGYSKGYSGDYPKGQSKD